MTIGKLIKKFWNYYWVCLIQISINNTVFRGSYLLSSSANEDSHGIFLEIRLGTKWGWERRVGSGDGSKLRTKSRKMNPWSPLEQVTGWWKKKTKDVYNEIPVEDVKCSSREVHGCYNKYPLKCFMHDQIWILA